MCGRRIALLALAAAFGTAVAAPVPKEIRRADDRRRIVGEWELTAATSNGSDFKASAPLKWTLDADGNADRVCGEGDFRKGNFTIDPTASPKRFTWKTAEGGDFHGVYDLDGDTFRVSLVTVTSPRPTTVTGNDGFCFEFKRAGRTR